MNCRRSTGTFLGCSRAVSLATVAMFSLIDSASAQETVVKNDSVVDGSTAAIQAGFDEGETAAVWLTSPCAGRIVAVQVFWRSFVGGALPTLEDNITIYSQGTFPNPGPIIHAFLEGPVMTDGVLNEFRYLDELNTIPLDVPVSQGEVFIVALKFGSNPSPFNGPSVVTDSNGCQPGKNAIQAIGLGWVSACSLGVSGDFMIRAVVNCEQGTGACCVPSGACVPDVSEEDCANSGGLYEGDDTLCSEANCPVLVGACCKSDGTCQDGLTSNACVNMSGVYQGNDTLCSGVTCPQPAEACCNAMSGFCFMLDPVSCQGFGGVPQGPGTTCVGPSANQCPTGACCLPNGTCSPTLTPAQCAAQSGVYQGTGSTCGQVSCPQPQGACCLTSGGCTVTSQSLCEGFGHTWKGQGTTCADGNMNGTADACEAPDGDMNVNSVVDGADLQIFTDAVKSSSTNPTHLAHGDFSGNGVMGTEDIDAMVDVLLNAP